MEANTQARLHCTVGIGDEVYDTHLIMKPLMRKIEDGLVAGKL